MERISDLVRRAGGLTNEAFPKGARLVRTIKIDEKERLQEIENLRMQSADSLAIINVSAEKEQAIGIDLAKILEEPGGKYDLILQERDVIKIPKLLQTVRLTGALLSPGTVRFDSKFSFMSYIDNSGGFSDDAKPSKSYVLYANGSIDRTHSFLGIRSYPKVEPGAEIIVPLKAVRRRMSFGEIVSFGSASASLALLLITILSKL